MSEQFKQELRDQLLGGLAPFERRRRRRRLAVVTLSAVAVLAAGSAVLISQREAPTTRLTAGPGDTRGPGSGTTVDTGVPPTTEGPASSVPFPVPGGPELDESAIRATTEVVSSFLERLRSNDAAGAAELWTGYPDTLGSPPASAGDEARAVVQQFAVDAAWLLADDDPEILVTPSVATVTVEPTVVPVATVVADVDGARRAAAFVFTDPTAGPQLRIDRLPTETVPLSPEPGASVEPGAVVVVATVPVEGGARAFINGLEVPSSLDLEGHTIIVPIPVDIAGDAVLTVSVATPESSSAVAAWYQG